MERITTVAGLKSAIQILEVEQNAKERLLKETFNEVYENLRPVNILKNTIRELFQPNYLRLNENVAGTAVGIASAFLLRKFFIGSSGSLTRKVLGKVIQFGLTKIAVRKSDSITSAGYSLFNRLFHKKRKISEERDE